MNHLHNRIEPFPALFWALGIILAHILQKGTQPAGLASPNSGTGTAPVRFNLSEEVTPPSLYLSCCTVLSLCRLAVFCKEIFTLYMYVILIYVDSANEINQ